MEISVGRNELLRELHLVQGIVERKNSIPVLSNVLVEANDGRLSVAATDLDVSLTCGCGAQVLAPGAITLAAKKLYEIVRALPESDVRVKSLPDSWVSLDCERVHFRIAGLPKEDFPALPAVTVSGAIDVPGPVLRDLIERTAFVGSGEDARYYLAGALLLLNSQGVGMVATDGHRLSYAWRSTAIPASEPQRVLLPRKAIQELGRLLEGGDDASVQQQDNHLIFSVGGRILASKKVEGQFPAYEKVIAVTGDKKIYLDREQIQAAIRRVSLLSSDRSRVIKLTLDSGTLQLLATSPELGEAREAIPTDYTGAAIEIGFNAQYLLDFLSVAGTTRIILELKDADSQGILRPQDATEVDHRYVVMPMRF